MTEGRRRLAAGLIAAVGLTLEFALTAQAADLPTRFGPLSLGMPWSDTRNAGAFTELEHPTTSWERRVRDCGYRSARFDLEGGSVLVTTQDHVVTMLSQAIPVKRDDDLMQVAARVVEHYGQPRQITLRDGWGAVTDEQARASHVILEYQGIAEATIAISGEPVWEYRITVFDPDLRRLENQTIRCAREREMALPAAKKKN